MCRGPSSRSNRVLHDRVPMQIVDTLKMTRIEYELRTKNRWLIRKWTLQLWMRFDSRSVASGVLPPGVGSVSEPWVDENGWYDATFASDTIRLRSCPFGRLNDIWSCFICGFWIAVMAPLLNSFRATSRASRASTARFGINGFSASCFGALCACKAFFCVGRKRRRKYIGEREVDSHGILPFSSIFDTSPATSAPPPSDSMWMQGKPFRWS